MEKKSTFITVGIHLISMNMTFTWFQVTKREKQHSPDEILIRLVQSANHYTVKPT